MLTPPELEPAEPFDVSVIAPPWARVKFAPLVDWDDRVLLRVGPVAAREGDHTTVLRWERRVDVDTGRSFHATAVRLETALGVQHESQWSLELDARTEFLTLHWLRIVRDGQVIDQRRRERLRLLQRETQMERLVLSGRWTLLAVLDDVRVGDVIEAGYSFETEHPIRGKGCEVFFAVPPQACIGAWRFEVRASAERAPSLRWKASSDAPEMIESEADGRRSWRWMGEQLKPREGEANAPGSTLDHVWVQVSDLVSWGDLSSAVARAWAAVEADGLPDEPAFRRPELVNAAAVIALINHLQSEFRYLSLDLQAGGWVPSGPMEVAVRRHGDCKDLAWLATTVLRSWGVKARPILVGSGFRERVADLLPMALAFNHAIVEVECDGLTRWFDLTARGQGGGFAERSVAWFGQGLPVDAGGADLTVQPGKPAAGLYALDEVILLDSRSEQASLVEQHLRVEGWQADALRGLRLAQGAENFAREREELTKRRYGSGKRIGTLQWRDDPVANVCELAEAFEFTGAVNHIDAQGRAVFAVPPGMVSVWFELPENKPRRLPWAMPFPLELRHHIELRTGERPKSASRRRRWSEPEFEATTEALTGSRGWAWTYHLEVKTPQIQAGRVADYRKFLSELFVEGAWRLAVPRGRTRPKRRIGFGELPPLPGAPTGQSASTEAVSGVSAGSLLSGETDAQRAARAAAAAEAKHHGNSGRKRRSASLAPRTKHRSGASEGKRPKALFIIAALIVVALVVVLVRGCGITGV